MQKTENKTNKEAVIFFNGGIGDTALLVPLVMELIKENYQVTGIFTNRTGFPDLFSKLGLPLKAILVYRKLSLLQFALRNRKKFSIGIINHLAKGKLTLWAGKHIAESVRVMQKPTEHSNSKNPHTIIPQQGLHEIEQNLLFIHKKFDTKIIRPLCFDGQRNNQVIIQPGTGNGNTPYKSWPSEYWKELLLRLSSNYKQNEFVLIGDESDKSIGETIGQIQNCTNLIGKTSVAEAYELIKGARLLISGDSGFLHLAFLCGTPTLSIWGGSDKTLYTYEKFDSQKHQVIHSGFSCGPCNSWLNPNTTKTENPANCPDFSCLKNLKPEPVFNKICQMLSNHV